MTDLESARIKMEQQLLPNMLEQQGMSLLNSILDKKGKFFTDLLAVFFGVADKSFTADKIKIYLQRAKSGDLLFDFLQVDMPHTGLVGMAQRLFFCIEETTGEVRYFTEEASLGGGAVLFLNDGSGCGKTSFSEVPQDRDKAFQKMANIFIRELTEKDT